MSLDLVPLIATASALGVGAISAPTLTRAIWPQPKTTFLSARIPWDRIEEDGCTVRTLGRGGGGLFRVIEIQGEIYSGVTAEEMLTRFKIRKGMFDGLAEKPVDIRFISTRSHLAVTPPPATDGLAQQIDAVWHQRFAESYVTTHHIILSVPTTSDRKKLDDAEQLMLTQLHKYGPKRLEVALTNKDGSIIEDEPSPLLSWLATYINGFPLIVLPAFDRLADRLSFANITFDKAGCIIYRDGDDELYSGAIGIRALPERATADIINDLMQIPAPISVTLHAKPYTKEKADGAILHRAKQAKLAFHNRLIADEWNTVQEQVNAGKEAFYKAELTIFASSRTRDGLSEAIGAIRTTLANHASRAVRETMLTERLWWSRLPGYNYYTRDYHLVSSNLADFTPLKAEPRGRTTCPFGPHPTRFFNTLSGSPYGFVFHALNSDAGHTLLIGPTGQGKSTLIMFLITGALSAYPNLRSFVFDRMQGCLVPFACYGGDYLIPDSQNMPLNPFLIEDSPEHRDFLRLWLQMLTQMKDDDTLDKINNAITMMMNASPEHRILSKQLNLIAQPGDFRKALSKWAGTTKYGRIFNGSRDALNLTGSRLVGFDMTEMHSDPQLSAAMTYYFLHRIRQMVTKTPTPHIVFIDEAPAMLKDEFFNAQAEVLFQEHRKLKGLVVMAAQTSVPFQSVVFQNNTALRIYLPNPGAKEEDLQADDLTPDEINYIKGRDKTAERFRYSALFKRQGESVILDTSLASLGGFLRAFSSSADDKATLLHLKEKHGASWLREFLPL